MPLALLAWGDVNHGLGAQPMPAFQEARSLHHGSVRATHSGTGTGPRPRLLLRVFVRILQASFWKKASSRLSTRKCPALDR